MTVTLTELRSDLYRLVDRVLETGEPLEIERNGRKLLITPTPLENKLANLIRRHNVVAGDPEDLVHLDWSDEWKA